MKNILVLTLGMSWQIVPEAVGFTNPDAYDFFAGSDEVSRIRKQYNIEPVDECWIVTVEGLDLTAIQAWAQKWHINLRFIICAGVKDFNSENEISTMRSLIYRTVLNAVAYAHGGKLYLSLSGGRKTMSADMQDAANLFGCDALFHIMETRECTGDIRRRYNSESLLDMPGAYASYYYPTVMNIETPPSFIISTDKEVLSAEMYPLDLPPLHGTLVYEENGAVLDEIQHRKKQSAQLYSNFYNMLISEDSNGMGRDIFRKLYFLPPAVLRRMQEYNIGSKDRDFIQKLPKADLHTHLGGVLSVADIISIVCGAAHVQDTQWHSLVSRLVASKNIEALREKQTELFQDKKTDFNRFYARYTDFVLSFEKDPELFDALLFGKNIDPDAYYKIGIDAYQRLGDFQGSSLLQSEWAIRGCMRVYIEKLLADNVRYVEIRCSPYKYTRLGLSAEQVVSFIMDEMDSRYCSEQPLRDYRIIVIIGREASLSEIKDSIDAIQKLSSANSRFSSRFAGVDLAGAESAAEPAKLRELFMDFLRDCIHITIHAGETESVENVWQAVYHLSADRIGHGLKLRHNPVLMSRFADKRIGIEMCPSSNDQIVGFRDPQSDDAPYPLLEYLKKGLRVTINTDNCGISRTTLTDEFIKASVLSKNLSVWQCLALIRNSICVSFAPLSVHTQLMRSFEDEILDVCLEYFKV